MDVYVCVRVYMLGREVESGGKRERERREREQKREREKEHIP